jgi:hypothetical protein
VFLAVVLCFAMWHCIVLYDVGSIEMY